MRLSARVRVASALSVATAALARRRLVADPERAVFEALNGLPDDIHPPVWIVMQAGSLGGVFVIAGIVRLSGRRRRALVLAVTGTAIWGSVKVVKRLVGRGRPAAYLTGVHIRGKEERGLGYPSGHAAVAFALAAIAVTDTPRALHSATWTAASSVAAARVYTGAHLPLDVVGGAAIGLVVGSIVSATVKT